MIELPEAITIGRQAEQSLVGRRVTELYGPTHLHKFTFFNGEPSAYRSLLVGRSVKSAIGRGIFVDLLFDGDIYLSLCDGINARHGKVGDPIPKKYQMLITFDDESFVSFTTSMYGGIYTFHKELDNKYRHLSLTSVSPLSSQYDQAFFEDLIARQKQTLSLKALLAAEQRIPGVGNGVLQDILFNAGLHPKRKLSSISDVDKENLFRSLKTTLKTMTDLGGRDTETDFLGNKGGYKTILSQYTYQNPCPRCSGVICREAYMGGSIYYCSDCQK